MAMATPSLLTAFTPVLNCLAARTELSGEALTLKPLKNSMAWEGAQFTDENSFIFHLTGEDTAEVDTALMLFQGPSE